jgi:hypothetical protein
MSEQEEPQHEILTAVSFGQVVLVPYFEGPRASVVMKQFSDVFCETSQIISDTEGNEMLANPGTSKMSTLSASEQVPWDKEKVIRGIAGWYGYTPDDAVNYGRVRAVIEGYAASAD